MSSPKTITSNQPIIYPYKNSILLGLKFLSSFLDLLFSNKEITSSTGTHFNSNPSSISLCSKYNSAEISFLQILVANHFKFVKKTLDEIILTL